MLDPAGIANWSVTHVDWSEGKWHPKSYKADDVSMELVKNITVRVLLLHYKIHSSQIFQCTLLLLGKLLF